jgi:hypothetical protein
MSYVIKLDTRIFGFVAGVSCAFIGSALFSIAEVVRLTLVDPPSHLMDLTLVLAILFWGCIFSFLPGGIGGFVLGWLLRYQMFKGTLTQGKAVKAGILLAGLASIFTCTLGILFLLLTPHHGWYYLLIDVWNGTIFTNLPDYLYYGLRFASGFGFEIITATTIACIAGGWTGRFLAKQLLSLP